MLARWNKTSTGVSKARRQDGRIADAAVEPANPRDFGTLESEVYQREPSNGTQARERCRAAAQNTAGHALPTKPLAPVISRFIFPLGQCVLKHHGEIGNRRGNRTFDAAITFSHAQHTRRPMAYNSPACATNKLDLNLLTALKALLTEKNVTRAGEAVHVTQSAMSGILARLRDYFGDPLIVQVGRKMELTSLAESLVEPSMTCCCASTRPSRRGLNSIP